MWCYSSHSSRTYKLLVFVEQVFFPFQQEVIIGKIQGFVFPRENQLRQQTSASSHTVLLIQLAEPIPLSCLSSWKLSSLPCDLHFLNRFRFQENSEEQLADESRGSLKFAWNDQDKSVVPCSLWIWGKASQAWLTVFECRGHICVIMWGWHLQLTCSPQSSLKALLSYII